ncbi:MAG: FtsX-like permease family protein [Parasporobacterium sp.]|nr:FtsX-like permease family protein [Parasporobacterium sp.]
MKRTQIKDITRTIKKQFISWISILVISAVSCIGFLGVLYAANGLKTELAKYCAETNYRDIEVVSTLLLTKEDIEVLKNIEGVKTLEPVLSTTGIVGKSDMKKTVSVVSLTKEVNKSIVLEGRLPENPNECAVESELLSVLGLEVGDTVNIQGSETEKPRFLANTEFKITGSVLHAEHYTGINQVPDNRNVLVLDEAFDNDQLLDCYTKAEIVIDKPDDMTVFSSGYNELVKDVQKRIEAISSDRERLRIEYVRSTYEEALAEAKTKLDLAKAKLDEGKAMMDVKETELAQGETQIEAAKQETAAARPELDRAREMLATAKAQLEDGARQIIAAKSEIRQIIADKVDELVGEGTSRWIAWAEDENIDVDQAITMIDYFQITKNFGIDLSAREIKEKIVEGVTQIMGILHIDEKTDEVIASIMASDEYKQAMEYISVGRGKVNEWLQAHEIYLDKLNEYNEAEAQYQEAIEQIEQGEAQINDGKAQLEEGKKTYEEGLAEYNAGKAEYDKQFAAYKSLVNCHWVIMDKDDSPNFAFASAGNLKNLGFTFGLVFVVVAALVIYATVGRIIDEQRKLVGAQKALGFKNKEIIKKYIIFGVTACLIGMALGSLAGYLGLQKVILDGYAKFYVVDSVERGFSLPLTIGMGAVLVGVACVSILIAGRVLTKQTATELMQEKMPETENKASKRKLKSSLYSRMIVRNIRNDIRRVVITIVSIAGCCIMLMIGFTMKDNIAKAINRQFEDIIRYDNVLNFDPDAEGKTEREIEAILEDFGLDYTAVSSRYTPFKLGDKISATDLVCADPEDVAKVLNLYSPQTGSIVEVEDTGIIIQKRTAEELGLSIGDKISIFNDNMDSIEIRVLGIYENYLGMQMAISKDAYRESFGAVPSDNKFMFGEISEKQRAKLEEKLSTVEGFVNISTQNNVKERFISYTAPLDIITIVMIFLSGVMAYFILFNLVNMYINQKKRELTIMRVNGFTTNEVLKYVLGETVLTTIFGIVLGLVSGAFAAYLILRFLEQAAFGYVRSISVPSFIISALLTAGFVIAINAVVLRKVKYLKLTDIN